MSTSIYQLPYEILILIFNRIAVNDLIHCSYTCAFLSDVCNDDFIWKDRVFKLVGKVKLETTWLNTYKMYRTFNLIKELINYVNDNYPIIKYCDKQKKLELITQVKDSDIIKNMCNKEYVREIVNYIFYILYTTSDRFFLVPLPNSLNKIFNNYSYPLNIIGYNKYNPIWKDVK